MWQGVDFCFLPNNTIWTNLSEDTHLAATMVLLVCVFIGCSMASPLMVDDLT